MTDLGKPTIDLMMATRAVMERDIELGLVEPQRLRFTIEARKEIVKQYADAGMSQRQIAKEVGVSKATVATDLNGQKPTEKRSETDQTPKEPKPPSVDEREVDIWAAKQRIADAVNYLCGPLDIPEYVKKLDRKVTPDRIRHAAEVLNSIADEVEKSI
jgi:transposase